MENENKNVSRFVELLEQEFQKRRVKNPRYSLRAFARLVGVETSMLSKYLRSLRGVRPATIETIGTALGWETQLIESLQREAFDLLRNGGLEQSYKIISDEEANVLLTWHNYALLELMDTVDYVQNPEWISKRLSISESEVERAFQNLQTLGFIQKNEKGRYLLSRQFNTTVGSQFSPQMLRKLQVQFMQQAEHAINTVPIDSRSNSNMTFAIDMQDLPSLLEEIKKFRRKINKKGNAGKSKNQVYNLMISFFPLTDLETSV